MSIDEDELLQLSKMVVDDAPSAAESIRDVLIRCVASTALPFGIGAAVAGLVTDAADRRWKENINLLMQLFAERVVTVQSAIESPDYYRAEEFQSLLFEAVDQERTNRYEAKRKMLARGLANSGTRPFVADTLKETYFRVLRDLTPLDISVLRELLKPTNKQHMGLYLKETTLQRVVRASSVTPVIYRLQGLGLVSMFQQMPSPNMNGIRNITDIGRLGNFIRDELQAEPQIVMQITNFGLGFLRFLTEPDEQQQNLR